MDNEKSDCYHISWDESWDGEDETVFKFCSKEHEDCADCKDYINIKKGYELSEVKK